jgi:hypothetical protein
LAIIFHHFLFLSIWLLESPKWWICSIMKALCKIKIPRTSIV